ncbi:hypothetical protein M419DRAFT_118649 [Trichoderma reesei RUT C-30]|uniref:Uncharacterized protein n=1 Tax=Hypocrea jecorina (strain ATCC 56765 / BCRC 32924 / NRRL 11460 / Rut C-30) TaxID=1344414 RepID=A0A024SCW2_HYPJR|nr:hypothetical protein M419DRAFT_118649 [Trichoderma reesei RUT C-30]
MFCPSHARQTDTLRSTGLDASRDAPRALCPEAAGWFELQRDCRRAQTQAGMRIVNGM